MPKAVVEINETHASITRPVVFSVVRQMAKKAGIPEDVEIIFGEYAQPDSLMDANDHVSSPDLETSRRLTIDVTEEFLTHRQMSEAAMTVEHPAIFADPKLDVYIKPIYAPVGVTITVTYRARSKTEALRWRNNVRRRSMMGRVELLHEPVYHYPVPEEHLVILSAIHACRERIGGYGEDFQTWLKNHFTQRMTSLTNQDASQAMLSIAEHQIGVIGAFDFEHEPEKADKENEKGPWQVEFEYYFEYDKVISCLMDYPLMIHNQMVPRAFREERIPYRLEDQIATPSWSRYYFDQLTTPPPKPGQAIAGISIPYYDDWLEKQAPPATITLLRIMLQVETETPTRLLNLTQLGPYQLHEDIVSYMKATHMDMGELFNHPIALTLYEGNRQVSDISLFVDENLEVFTDQALDIRKRYHLRISLVYDISILSSIAKEKMRKYGKAGLVILRTIRKDLAEKGKLPRLVGGKKIPRKDFDDLVGEFSRIRRESSAQSPHRHMALANFVVNVDEVLNDGDR